MATEKQIAANRSNAKRSTGPKTSVGKLKSSRNAFRHGLSAPLPLDLPRSEQVDAISRILAGEEADEAQLRSMTEVAQAQLELLHIRKIRSELMAAIDIDVDDFSSLRRLMSLDRYERYASTKRRRAARELEVTFSPQVFAKTKPINQRRPASKPDWLKRDVIF